jgi:hypothetical protein
MTENTDNINRLSPKAKMAVLALRECKGQFLACEWTSEPKPLALHKGKVLRKFSKATVRTGVEFRNLSSVKEAIEAGEREEVGSLPWGEWMVYPYIITHKANEYIRLTLTEGCPIASRYEVDGVEVDASTFYAMLPKQSGERPAVLTVKVANLVRLG